MRSTRYKSRRLMYQDLVASPDKVTKQFIKLMTYDAEFDYILSRVLALFATDMPQLHGTWSHHNGLAD